MGVNMAADQGQPMAGLKVAVLVESLYIPEEINAYKAEFPKLGATVQLVSRLWDQPSQKFVSDPDGLDEKGNPRQAKSLIVNVDLEQVKVDDYAAVIMSANYTSVRLRYFHPPQGPADAPAVRFFAAAMENKGIIKGALCHGLWILRPRPDLLRGRRVTCHEVVRADVLNAGAVDASSEGTVVVDEDLVTGHSKTDVKPFIAAIAAAVAARQPSAKKGGSYER
jgi:protease I